MQLVIDRSKKTLVWSYDDEMAARQEFRSNVGPWINALHHSHEYLRKINNIANLPLSGEIYGTDVNLQIRHNTATRYHELIAGDEVRNVLFGIDYAKNHRAYSLYATSSNDADYMLTVITCFLSNGAYDAA